MDFQNIITNSREKGLGSSANGTVNGEALYLSRGIREALLCDLITTQDLIDVTGRFQKADFGNAAEFGKTGREGHEYGRYDLIEFDPTGEDTGVWIHRAEGNILAYFKFER